MNLIDAKTALAAFVAADIPTFLWGAPGVGKSQIVRQMAEEHGAGFIDYRLSTLETVDLRGLPHIVGTDVEWSRPDLFQAVCAFPSTQPVYVFFDEMNVVSPSMMAASMQLVLDRRIGPHTFPANVRIIAAGNRQSDRAAANKMPTALSNRFAHIDVEADAKIARSYYERKGYDPVFCAFFGFRPNLIHVMPKDDSRGFPTPRAWEQISRLMSVSDDLRPILVRGIVGESAGAEFEFWMLTNRHVPKLAEILADPYGTRVPGQDQPALQYATCAMCAASATRQNFGALITYVERIGKDLSVAAVYDATTRDKTLMNHPDFISWVARNSDLTT